MDNDNLNPQQEAFCQYYTQIRDTFGNATRAYAEAYGYDLDGAPDDDAIYETVDGKEKCVQESTYTRMEAVCASAGSRLLRNVKIDRRVKELLAAIPNETIDARLNEIIIKGRDTDSINAIKELNKLRQRITEKVDVTSGGKTIAGFNFIRNSNGNTTDDTPDA